MDIITAYVIFISASSATVLLTVTSQYKCRVILQKEFMKKYSINYKGNDIFLMANVEVAKDFNEATIKAHKMLESIQKLTTEQVRVFSIRELE